MAFDDLSNPSLCSVSSSVKAAVSGAAAVLSLSASVCALCHLCDPLTSFTCSLLLQNLITISRRGCSLFPKARCMAPFCRRSSQSFCLDAISTCHDLCLSSLRSSAVWFSVVVVPADGITMIWWSVVPLRVAVPVHWIRGWGKSIRTPTLQFRCCDVLDGVVLLC